MLLYSIIQLVQRCWAHTDINRVTCLTAPKTLASRISDDRRLELARRLNERGLIEWFVFMRQETYKINN